MTMLYFGLGDADLRDLYPGSAWLTFADQIVQTTFAREDVVILSEDLVKSRSEMLTAIHHIRGFGARIVYVGWSGNESDDWKRQLAFFGIYDWLFVEAEINLEDINRLLAHPRTAKDVECYLEDLQMKPVPALQVVLVCEEGESGESVETFTQTLLEQAGTEEEAERSVLERMTGAVSGLARGVRGTLRRRRGESGGETAVDPASLPMAPRRFVWSAPRPVTVRLVGDPGVGKSFIAWNLAALCNAHELSAAVIEPDSPIAHWGEVDGVHVTTETPGRGYRVHIATGPLDMRAADGDVRVAVTWPDPARSEKAALALWQGDGEEDREVWWIVNYGDDERPLPDGVPLSERVLVVPYEARQAGAVRMKTPLVLSDPLFAARLVPLVEHIKARFAAPARSQRKEEDVDVALA